MTRRGTRGSDGAFVVVDREHFTGAGAPGSVHATWRCRVPGGLDRDAQALQQPGLAPR